LIESAGISALVLIRKASSARGATTRIVGACQSVRGVLELMGLTRHFGLG
jgi:anti-anti-sigma regulatory factor